MNRRSRVHTVVLLVMLVALLSCCTPPPYRMHPDFMTRMEKMRTIGLATPDIKIYSLSAGGVRELRDDWSAEGQQAVREAVVASFKQRHIAVVPVQRQDSGAEMADLQALYRAVSDSVLDHTYSETERFPHKMKRFDYTVGSVEKVLKGSGADGMVIVYAFDEISTAGRKTLKVLTSPLSMITGIKPRSGYSAMSVALVAASGEVLWYNIHANEGGYDLREPGSAASFLKLVLLGFPRRPS
ncbi:MAG: hypothetical protein ABIR88_09635 [Nitrospiria bacterium]